MFSNSIEEKKGKAGAKECRRLTPDLSSVGVGT